MQFDSLFDARPRSPDLIQQTESVRRWTRDCLGLGSESIVIGQRD
jgi:hypothetical protein